MAKRHRIVVDILPFIIVLFSVFAAMAVFIVNANYSIRNQSIEDILEITNQGRHAFDTYISRETELLHYLSLNFSKIDSSDPEELQSSILALAELEPDYFVINLEDGSMYSNHYEKRSLDMEKLDRFSSVQGCVIKEPGESEYTGLQVLSCYEIFRFEDGSKGLVQSEHRVKSVVDEFSLSFYDGEGYSYIINSDGKILVRSDSPKANRTISNIFDIIDRNGNSEEDIQRFRSSLSEGKSGAARFTYSGEENVYTYVPLKTTGNWYFVSIIPNSVIMKHTNKVLINSRLILISVAICAIVLVISVYEVIKRHRRIVETDRISDFFVSFLTTVSKSENTVFIMLNPDTYGVEFVSSNAERVLGITEKRIRANLKALDSTGYEDETAVDFDLYNSVEPGCSVSVDVKKIHSITGEELCLKETVYRLSDAGSGRIILVLSDRTKFEDDDI